MWRSTCTATFSRLEDVFRFLRFLQGDYHSLSSRDSGGFRGILSRRVSLMHLKVLAGDSREFSKEKSVLWDIWVLNASKTRIFLVSAFYDVISNLAAENPVPAWKGRLENSMLVWTTRENSIRYNQQQGRLVFCDASCGTRPEAMVQNTFCVPF